MTFFLFEKAPKINPTLRLGNLDRIAPLTRRKSKIALLRAAATLLSAGKIPLTGPKILKPNLKLATKSPSIMEDIVDQFDPSPGDFGEELGEIVDSNYAELSDNELVDKFLAEPSALQQSSGTNPSQIALLSAITDVTTQVLPVPTITRAQQLENLFNTRMSGGIHLNSALVVLDSLEILSELALNFQTQANAFANNFTLSQVIVYPATEIIQFTSASDPKFTILTKDKFATWLEHVTVAQAAQIVTKYFGAKSDIRRTLVENFPQIPVRFNFSHRALKRQTFVAMKSLTHDYSIVEPITQAQHAALIVTIEKKLKPDCQLRTDYFERKKANPTQGETWEDAYTRFVACIASVRELNEHIA